MRYLLLIKLFLLSISFTLNAQKLVILDTDPGYDPDDVGCMAMLHTLAGKGECHILAIVNSTDMKESPLCISAINRFYNRKAIPVGDYKGYPEKLDAPGDTYHYHVANTYPGELKDWQEAPDAVALYREILASAADTSITIVITGTMHNFYGLLQSASCKFSELEGIELVRKKVKQVATMGGNFINGKGLDRTNWGGSDALCSYTSWSCLNKERNLMCRFVIEHCPAPFVASGWEVGCGDYHDADYGNVMTGQGLKDLDPGHVVRQSYEAHFRTRGGADQIDRHSNDQCALLYALRGEGDNFQAWLYGDIELSETGICSWKESEGGLQGYIQKKRDKELIAAEIESLMMGEVPQPDKTPPEQPSGLSYTVRDHSLVLEWEAAVDPDPGSWVVAYHIYMNGVLLSKAHGLKYIHNGYPDRNATFEVKALNAAGMESGPASLRLSAKK